MSTATFTYKSTLPAPVEDVFGWHERPGAFERLSPPWVQIDVLERKGSIHDGDRVTLHITNGLIGVNWTLEHRNYVKNERFSDFQISGPLCSWEQVHLFKPEDADRSTLEDIATYDAGLLKDLGVRIVADHELSRLFAFRHRVLKQDLQFKKAHAGSEPKIIAVTGATGMIGGALLPFLSTQGHSVRSIGRVHSQHKGVRIGEKFSWDPSHGTLDASACEGAQAVVHLAGDSVGSERWNAEKKRRIRASRLNSTKLLVNSFAKLQDKPKVFVCASAIGYYGDRHEETLTESSSRGSGFLAELCEEWENVAHEAESSGIRVVCIRIGVVLSPKGGALQKMLLPFQMGAGGPIGSGKQQFSWIALDDVVAAILHVIENDSVAGAVNFTAPNVVTNLEYTRALGRVIGRPTIMTMPAFAARMAFGEFADECLLASTRVVPEKLLASGYEFQYPDVESALRHVLGR